MEKPRPNWRFVIVLLLASAVFIGAVLFVHRWQRKAESQQGTVVTTPSTQ